MRGVSVIVERSVMVASSVGTARPALDAVFREIDA